MGIFYPDVAYRRLGYMEDEHNGKNSLLWLTLALWITLTTAQGCHQSGSFWCIRSLNCIPSSYRCDNYNDCTYGEDEADCSQTTSSSQSNCQQMGDFWCSRSSMCIPLLYKCDNYSNCNYGEDEANCSHSPEQHCLEMRRFWCANSRQCIDSLRICDNTNDCIHREDEQGCTHGSSVNTAAIVAGTVCGVVVLVLFVLALIRAMAIRRMREANRRPNNTSETTAPRPPAVRPTPPAPVRPTPPAPVRSRPPAPVLSRSTDSVLSRQPAPVFLRPPAAPVWSRPPALLWSGPQPPVWSGAAAPVWSGPAASVWSGPPATVWSRPPVPVWSTQATNYVQFGAPSWQAGGRQGPDGLPMELYVPHSCVVANQVYATSQQANPVAQSGEMHSPTQTPDVTAQSTH